MKGKLKNMQVLRTENLELKKELLKWQSSSAPKKNTPPRQLNAPDKSSHQKKDHQKKPDEPSDVVLIHDSICKHINPGILSRHNLNTILAYTQDEALQVQKIHWKISSSPKVVNVVGTNDVRDTKLTRTRWFKSICRSSIN